MSWANSIFSNLWKTCIQKDGQADGQRDRWMDRRTDGRTDVGVNPVYPQFHFQWSGGIKESIKCVHRVRDILYLSQLYFWYIWPRPRPWIWIIYLLLQGHLYPFCFSSIPVWATLPTMQWKQLIRLAHPLVIAYIFKHPLLVWLVWCIPTHQWFLRNGGLVQIQFTMLPIYQFYP